MIIFSKEDFSIDEDLVFDLSVEMVTDLFKNDDKSWNHYNSHTNGFDSVVFLFNKVYFKRGNFNNFPYVTEKYLRRISEDDLVIDPNIIFTKFENVFGKISEEEKKVLMKTAIRQISKKKNLKLEYDELYDFIFVIKDLVPVFFKKVEAMMKAAA